MITSILVSALTLMGLVIASAAIKPMREIAALAPTPRLKRIWWGLMATMAACIILQFIAMCIRHARSADVGDLLAAWVHLLGPSFVLGTTWLTRKTAKEILRIADLERALCIDTLTTLPNRRFFEASLADEIGRCERLGHPLHLVLLDLDHFKRVNDTLGHRAGDAVLRQVAMLMRDAVGEPDRVCRIGGEEFAIILPELSADQVLLRIERTRGSIERADLDLARGSTTRVTASLGAAKWLPGDTADLLFSRADAALYAAKHAGRNRTQLAA